MKNISFDTAEKFFAEPNFYYIIEDIIDLGGNTLTIPTGSTLDFRGGYFQNGTIVLKNTKILPNYNQLIKGGVTVTGNPAETIYVQDDGVTIRNAGKWLDDDGATHGVSRSGVWQNKPSSADIYVGFEYFCTDRKVDMDSSSPTYMQVITPIDPDTGGMLVIHKGSGVWVDALGRVVY